MPSLPLLLAFFGATAVYAYMPGPAMLYAAAQTIGRGRRAGLMAALGIHLGGYVHVFAAALGLSAMFAAVPLLYLVLKIAGAAYLIWLGTRMVFRKTEFRLAELSPAKSAGRAFVESMTVEILNPKTAIFFVAFLPQFTDLSATLPLWLQFIILGTIVNLMFTSADLVCVAMAGAVMRRLKRSSRVRAISGKVGGALLIGLGANLALQRG